MPQTTKYASLSAKIGAKRSNLLGEAKLKTLSETKSLDNFAALLRETIYGEGISKIGLPYSSGVLERAFRENLIELFVKIIKTSPESVSCYLKTHLQRLEVENIKTIVRGIIAQLSEDQKQSRIYISVENFLKNRVVFEKAISAVDLKQLSSALEKTEYAEAVDQGIKSYEENGTIICFDVLVDKVFYEDLYLMYQLLPRKEKLHARFYADIESTSYILLTVLRGKILNHEINWLRVALPHKHFLQKELVEALVVSNDFDSVFSLVLKSPYAKFFAKAKTPEETINLAEKAFKKALLVHAMKSRVAEAFNIGLPLAFMYLKENEVQNLAGLSVGLESAAKAEDIVRALIFAG